MMLYLRHKDDLINPSRRPFDSDVISLSGSIYFIVKYQGNFKAAAVANAMVGGDNASRGLHPLGYNIDSMTRWIGITIFLDITYVNIKNFDSTDAYITHLLGIFSV